VRFVHGEDGKSYSPVACAKGTNFRRRGTGCVARPFESPSLTDSPFNNGTTPLMGECPSAMANEFSANLKKIRGLQSRHRLQLYHHFIKDNFPAEHFNQSLANVCLYRNAMCGCIKLVKRMPEWVILFVNLIDRFKIYPGTSYMHGVNRTT
jgi:hypothetical protein